MRLKEFINYKQEYHADGLLRMCSKSGRFWSNFCFLATDMLIILTNKCLAVLGNVNSITNCGLLCEAFSHAAITAGAITALRLFLHLSTSVYSTIDTATAPGYVTNSNECVPVLITGSSIEYKNIIMF